MIKLTKYEGISGYFIKFEQTQGSYIGSKVPSLTYIALCFVCTPTWATGAILREVLRNGDL